MIQQAAYPIQFSVEYPDRPLDRISSAFRIFWAIPIFIILSTVSGAAFSSSASKTGASFAAAGGLLVVGPALMIIFRQKYPRWWFDWNLQLLRFSNRVDVYVALMDDRYPSTDEDQSVRLDMPYPDVERDLERWLPIIKWFLAIPHYFVLIFFGIGAFFAVIGAWFAILFTGRYPRGIFDYVEGVMRYGNRVLGYAFLMVTDQYPPFRLSP